MKSLILAALAGIGLLSASASAQTAWGVSADGTLFYFDVNTPAVTTTVGLVGFTPEGIDFRPATNTLYAIDVGPNTTQLYTLNLATAAATPVGTGFASSGTNYTLAQNQEYGFDFNPKTLQADTSMRIRLVNTAGANLRLNSSTGGLAAVDTNLAIGTNSPFVSGAAYINNVPEAGGATTLYDIDTRNASLYTQVPPNAGTLNLVGPLGATITNVQTGVGFDVYTDPLSTDPTLAGDEAFAVLKRPDAPVGGPLGAYLLYDVNLATGQITNGALVGDPMSPRDFTGGFAVQPGPIPEPALLSLVAFGAMLLRRR
jgi:DNA-binding beta-propeller fold protein YncE